MPPRHSARWCPFPIPGAHGGRHIRDSRLAGVRELYYMFALGKSETVAILSTLHFGRLGPPERGIAQIIAARLRGRGPNADFLAAAAARSGRAPCPTDAALRIAIAVAAGRAADEVAAEFVVRHSLGLPTLVSLAHTLLAYGGDDVRRETLLPERREPPVNRAEWPHFGWVVERTAPIRFA